MSKQPGANSGESGGAGGWGSLLFSTSSRAQAGTGIRLFLLVGNLGDFFNVQDISKHTPEAKGNSWGSVYSLSTGSGSFSMTVESPGEYSVGFLFLRADSYLRTDPVYWRADRTDQRLSPGFSR